MLVPMIVSLILLLALSGPSHVVQCSNETEHQDALLIIDLVRVKSQVSSVDDILGCQFASVAHNEPLREDESCHLKRMNMLHYNQLDYIGEIRVGQPAKMFRLLLDSGSAELWLLASNCSSNQVNRTMMATYDWKQSSSFENDGRPIMMSYANGVAVSGRLARDNFQLGDLFIEGLTFVQIDRASRYVVEGILGLGLHSFVPYADVEPPIDTILREAGRQSNGASKRMVSLSLNHGLSDGQKAGQLIIGGLDHSRYVGQVTWAPLGRSKEWRFRVDAIELAYLDVNHQPITSELNVCPYGCEVVADTGTALIIGNAKQIHALNERIGAYHIDAGVYALASCDNLDSRLPQLVVTISGRKFSLKPSQYIFQVGPTCLSGIRELHAELPLILGSIFLGHYYTIMDYDNHRFGLAESPFKSEGSIIKQ